MDSGLSVGTGLPHSRPGLRVLCTQKQASWDGLVILPSPTGLGNALLVIEWQLPLEPMGFAFTCAPWCAPLPRILSLLGPKQLSVTSRIVPIRPVSFPLSVSSLLAPAAPAARVSPYASRHKIRRALSRKQNETREPSLPPFPTNHADQPQGPHY